MKTKARICILTSSHTAYDERFFHKQAKSLVRAGYDATIVAPHPADEVADGIRIKAVPKAGSRLGRLLLTPIRVLMAGLKEKADLYHFHDPELIPTGLALRLMGRKVIYDVHEYYKLKLMSKSAMPQGARYFASWTFDVFESAASRFFNGVIVVDKVTEAKFKGKAVKVSNYPYRLEKSVRHKMPGDAFKCVYAGGISADRGLFKMVEAMEYVDDRVRLVLLGRYKEEDRLNASKLNGYEKVDWLGFLPWPEVIRLLPDFDLGLVLLQPTPAYLYAGENTVKLFEYMGSGLPVLGSNFTNLERIITDEGCGDTVNPTDHLAIARKITYFADNPEIARGAGEKGRKAVMEKYNWEMEAEKLIGLYGRILDGGLTRSGRKAEA